jgi:hypothetical protein
MMRIFKFLRGKIVYRRVGPMLYQTKAQRRACDYDEKHNDQFRIF